MSNSSKGLRYWEDQPHLRDAGCDHSMRIVGDSRYSEVFLMCDVIDVGDGAYKTAYSAKALPGLDAAKIRALKLAKSRAAKIRASLIEAEQWIDNEIARMKEMPNDSR